MRGYTPGRRAKKSTHGVTLVFIKLQFTYITTNIMDIQDNNNLATLEGAQGENKEKANNPRIPAKRKPRANKKPLSDICKITPKVNDDDTFQIYNLLRMGYGEVEIRKMYQGMSDKKFNTLIKRARAIQKKAVLDYDAAKADVVDKLWHNYHLAQEIGDIKDSTIILQAIAKVLGLTRDVNFEGSQFVTVWAK